MPARLVAAAAFVAFAFVPLGLAPAWASCVSGDPPRSAHAFTGVVLATSSGGRVATVQTEAGPTVEVRGTDATGPDQVTSVDRTYRVGGRYEFDPTNAAPPWEDNACTATRLLSNAALADTSRGATDSRHDSANGALGWVAGATSGAAALIVGIAVVRVRRRRPRGPVGVSAI